MGAPRVLRSFEKKVTPVSMSKLLSHGYVEEKKTPTDDDASSTSLCLYQLYQYGQVKRRCFEGEGFLSFAGVDVADPSWDRVVKVLQRSGSAGFVPGRFWLTSVAFCFSRRDIGTDEHRRHGGRGRAGVAWIWSVVSQTRLFSEPLTSIDGFVLTFMPNLYLFFSVHVLVIAVFCVFVPLRDV